MFYDEMSIVQMLAEMQRLLNEKPDGWVDEIQVILIAAKRRLG